MAPRRGTKAAAASPTRSSGRITRARAAATAAAAAAVAKGPVTRKRGRPSAVAKEVVAEPAKRRGRPSKAKAPAEAVQEAPATRKRGRKAIEPEDEPVLEDALPRKRARRTAPVKGRKTQAAPAGATKKRRGRPSKAEVDLARAAAAPNTRITKRTSGRAKAAAPNRRKKRGFTTMEIPDRYVDAVRALVEQMEDLHRHTPSPELEESPPAQPSAAQSAQGSAAEHTQDAGEGIANVKVEPRSDSGSGGDSEGDEAVVADEVEEEVEADEFAVDGLPTSYDTELFEAEEFDWRSE